MLYILQCTYTTVTPKAPFQDVHIKGQLILKGNFSVFNFPKSGLRVKIGHHKIRALAEIGQNRIRGGEGVRKNPKMWDIIYARSLR